MLIQIKPVLQNKLLGIAGTRLLHLDSLPVTEPMASMMTITKCYILQTLR